jgi:hypothetical protein
MIRRSVAPAVVRAAEHPWIRIGVGAIAFIVAALAVAILVAQSRGAHRDRIIGQLACQVQRLGGQPVGGASCPPTARPSPAPAPAVSREAPPTIVLTPAPGRPTVVVVPVPASSGAPRPSGSPAPARSSSRPRPSPTPTCTPVPVISVCRPTPLGP